MAEKTSRQDKLDKNTIINLSISAFLAIFCVVFLWNFWERGPYALGINAFVFLVGLLGFFIWLLSRKKKYTTKDLFWIIPFGLMSLSFLLYDNPFIKMVSILVIPLSFTVFYNFAMLADQERRWWSWYFAVNILQRVLMIMGSMGKSISFYLEFIIPANRRYKKIIAKALFGLSLFLIIALTIFIPLLSSADGEFGEMMQIIYTGIQELLAIPIMYRIITAIILSILIFATVLAWDKRFDYQEKNENPVKADDIISGIVLGGVLLLYFLFLWVQVGHLLVGNLPFDFKETENLVKSGFWQLFVLTLLNILIFFWVYKRTKSLVQSMLALFIIASLLLLISAGYRVGLYVIYYGFSYEKFFASYTVLYCAILLLWLASRLFIEKRADIIKFVAVLFIWMFGLISIFPIEQFILRSNIALSHLENSRIRLFELTMLSPDVLALIKTLEQQGILKEKNNYFTGEGVVKSEAEFDWTAWIARQEKDVMNKAWYELNFMNVKYKFF